MSKKIVRIILALFLLGSMLPAFNSAEASSTYSATVKTSSLTVREKATTHSKKLGTLKRGTKLTVVTKTKSGWSKINFKKRSAYVLTKYLTFQPSKKTSYLKDKTKTYVFQDNRSGASSKLSTYKYSKSKNGWNYWSISNSSIVYREKQTGSGFYSGDGIVDYLLLILPVKVGKNFYDQDAKYTIKSKSKTIKTKAGTFKNCIEVKNNMGETYYYKNGVGLVKYLYIDQQESSSVELIKIFTTTKKKTVKINFKDMNFESYFNDNSVRDRQDYLFQMGLDNPLVDKYFWEIYDYLDSQQGKVSNNESVISYIEKYLTNL